MSSTRDGFSFPRFHSFIAGDRLAGGAVSLLVHAAVFAAGTKLLVHPAEYGMQASGGIEVNLVAALPGASGDASATTKESELPVEPQAPPAPSSDESFALPEPEAPAAPEPASAVKGESSPPSTPAASGSLYVGDGSSPVPGKDATTFHSSGGGWSDGRPGYLKNLIPPYPEQARRLGQQGVVMLRVRIDKRGIPSRVVLEKSSGYPLLDESALRMVPRWKFQPARVGSILVETEVKLPIRFVLD